MKRGKGVTLAEIMETTGWQAHTVRGFVSILGGTEGKITPLLDAATGGFCTITGATITGTNRRGSQDRLPGSSPAPRGKR